MENNNKNVIIGVLSVLVVLLVVVVVVVVSKGKENSDDGLNTNTVNNSVNQNNNSISDSTVQSYLDDVSSSLGWLVVVSSFSDNKIMKNTNYLNSNANKQLMTMEYILKDDSNVNDFVVLGSDGETVVFDSKPTDGTTVAYYSYEAFDRVYRKLFGESFDAANREVSMDNNKYDKDSSYVYYNNRRSGANGLSIESMQLTNNSYDSNTLEYTAQVTLTYSDRLASNVGVTTDVGEITYVVDGTDIVIKSFIIK